MDAIGKLTMHMKIHFIVVNTEVMFVKLLQSVLDPSDPPTVTEALIRTPSGAEKVWCREERGRRNSKWKKRAVVCVLRGRLLLCSQQAKQTWENIKTTTSRDVEYTCVSLL